MRPRPLLFRPVGERVDRAGGWAGCQPRPLSLPPSTGTRKGGQGTRAHTYLMYALTHMLTAPQWGIYVHDRSIPCSQANVHTHILTHPHTRAHMCLPSDTYISTHGAYLVHPPPHTPLTRACLPFPCGHMYQICTQSYSCTWKRASTHMPFLTYRLKACSFLHFLLLTYLHFKSLLYAHILSYRHIHSCTPTVTHLHTD